MASAYVEFGMVALRSARSASLHDTNISSDILTVSGSEDETAAFNPMAILAADYVARITTDESACYVAVGTAPDTTAIASTTLTSARRYLGAGATISLVIRVGEKVAVKAVS